MQIHTPPSTHNLFLLSSFFPPSLSLSLSYSITYTHTGRYTQAYPRTIFLLLSSFRFFFLSFCLLLSYSLTYTHTCRYTHAHPCTINLFFSLFFSFFSSFSLSYLLTYTRTFRYTHPNSCTIFISVSLFFLSLSRSFSFSLFLACSNCARSITPQTHTHTHTHTHTYTLTKNKNSWPLDSVWDGVLLSELSLSEVRRQIQSKLTSGSATFFARQQNAKDYNHKIDVKLNEILLHYDRL